MYYEQKFIDGWLHFRCVPKDKWTKASVNKHNLAAYRAGGLAAAGLVKAPKSSFGLSDAYLNACDEHEEKILTHFNNPKLEILV